MQVRPQLHQGRLSVQASACVACSIRSCHHPSAVAARAQTLCKFDPHCLIEKCSFKHTGSHACAASPTITSHSSARSVQDPVQVRCEVPQQGVPLQAHRRHAHQVTHHPFIHSNTQSFPSHLASDRAFAVPDAQTTGAVVSTSTKPTSGVRAHEIPAEIKARVAKFHTKPAVAAIAAVPSTQATPVVVEPVPAPAVVEQPADAPASVPAEPQVRCACDASSSLMFGAGAGGS